MKAFAITIEMENDAFEEDPMREVTRVLDDLKPRLLLSGPRNTGPWTLRDSNGNTVGAAQIITID